jgi:hypothetical protein
VHSFAEIVASTIDEDTRAWLPEGYDPAHVDRLRCASATRRGGWLTAGTAMLRQATHRSKRMSSMGHKDHDRRSHLVQGILGNAAAAVEPPHRLLDPARREAGAVAMSARQQRDSPDRRYERLQEPDAMHTHKTMTRLFQEAPTQWGLRGDPLLWRDMQATLDNQAYPSTEAEFTAVLAHTFEHLTGRPLTHPDPILVERYRHGGMSSGFVSPQFWAETAIPLLRARYRETR